MKDNVINFKRNEINEKPDDLITVSQFSKKHGTSKGFIYGLIEKDIIKPYPVGYLKISEKQAYKAIITRKLKWRV